MVHLEFLTIETNNPNVGGGHASHVAGTLGASGVSGSAKGMAPKSYIVAVMLQDIKLKLPMNI